MAKSTKKKELPSIEEALKPFMENGDAGNDSQGMAEAPQAAFTAEAKVDSAIGRKILKSGKAARPERAPRIDGTEGIDLMDPANAPAAPKGRIHDDGSASLPAQKNIEALLARGRPFYVADDAPEWVPHRPERP